MDRRVVCVSGSTQGIGLAIAEAFARTGARLVINSHREDDASAQALKTLSALTDVQFVHADLSSAGGAADFISKAHQCFGRLDTLVNNAGTFRDSAFDELTEQMFDTTFALNVKGYLFATQAFVRRLAAEQQNPSIICIGSTNSEAAERDSVIYDASKGAVLMLVRSLAVTLAGRGIRVNGIGPGIVETPLTRAGLDAPMVRNRLKQQIPMGRIAEPDDIGGAAVFLASPEARYITGQMLFVDGGILANQMSWGD
ncbi:short-chain dehydrogenase [Devosia epidermidihirudinis]|uniref:Short-chain dehydrogenase n=1 Tax=Devosia epidermidihirudinis TaxID=1293439 RepID=A0A0F5Q9A4_9HYPH|nr:SDR family oxidoreductase [Devosia epidermidihirudinis]KKC37296.1 short-chain dehydrogenase [Devosia epidermidihirudinis]